MSSKHFTASHALEVVKGLELPLSSNLLGQVHVVRRVYREKTGKKLSWKLAVHTLSLVIQFREFVQPAAETEKKHSFNVCCPHCYCDIYDLGLAVNDMAGEAAMNCYSCYSTFSAQEARDIVAAQLGPWDELLSFINFQRLEVRHVEEDRRGDKDGPCTCVIDHADELAFA
jgi:hypothetical protein